MKVTGIILAAGQSKRMGRNKLILDCGGKSLVERAVDAVVNSRIHSVIVVVGHEGRKVEDLLEGRPVRIVHNLQYREGMASSLREGVRHVDPKADAVLVALADHPFMTSETINRLIDIYESTERGIVCPIYEGRRGHPVIFNRRKYGQMLLQLRGDVGGRDVMADHPNDVTEMAVDSPAVIRDIDVLKEYEETLRMLIEKPCNAGRSAVAEGKAHKKID